MHSLSFHGDNTFFGQVPVEHQFAMPQVVQHWPKVHWVSVNEIGTGFILKESRGEKKETISGMPKAFLLQPKKERNQQESAPQSTLVKQGSSSNT